MVNKYSSFNQYIADFRITNCDNILCFTYGNEITKIYSFIGRSLYIRCKFIKQILNVKGIIMMNYFVIYDKEIINYIINKTNIVLQNYTRIFKKCKKVFLPYVWNDDNKEKMIVCSSFHYKSHLINDYLLSTHDIIFKLKNLKVGEEIEGLFDFDINTFDNYAYINLSPICIY